MAGKIRVTQVEKAPGYFEFDYTLPNNNFRVRRKIQATQYQADILKDLLNRTLENRLNESKVFHLINTTAAFMPHRDYLVDSMKLLYFSYFDNSSAGTDYEKRKRELLASKFPLNHQFYKRVSCLLGRTGVGKSTIIRKVSPFFPDEKINFPFTDTSRTTSFPIDYCFVSKQSGFKFLAILKPAEIVDMYISECIEHGIYKLIELRLSGQAPVGKDIDTVINSFLQDSMSDFDIRFSLGGYIPTTSPRFSKPDNQETIHFWQEIFCSFEKAVNLITKGNCSTTNDITYYQVLFSDAIKSGDERNPIYQEYVHIKMLIDDRSKAHLDELIQELGQSKVITPNSAEIKVDGEMVPYFCCTIDNMTDKLGFYNFIKVFTTKGSSEFGHSLFNRVDHLRIELPFNPNLKMPKDDFSLALQDTIGIAHTMSNTSGFENSTNLSLRNVDSVVLVEDSTASADNNTTAILQHLISRMDPSRIYFAFTHFDDLNKSTFDFEDDLDRQRKDYLIIQEISAIKSMALEDSETLDLIQRIKAEKNTLFLSGLMKIDDTKSIQAFVNTLSSTPLKTSEEFHKKDLDKPIVSYDYKKLPLIYEKALASFRESQKQIYAIDPPHYRTTEALTNRLWLGQTYFNGARNLRPVDDLFDVLIRNLASFINTPTAFNLQEVGSDIEEDLTSQIISQVRTEVTEGLREYLNGLFLEKKDDWYKLYALTGTGSDSIRRSGILKEENTIASSTDDYLYSKVDKHIITALEKIFQDSIRGLEKEPSQRN